MLHLDKGQSAPSLSGPESGMCSSRAWQSLHLPGFVSHLHLLVLQSARNQHPPGTTLPLLTLTEGAVAGLGRNQTLEDSLRLLFANNLKVEHIRHSHCATPYPSFIVAHDCPPAQAADEEEEADPVETALTKYGIITENPWEKGVK